MSEPSKPTYRAALHAIEPVFGAGVLCPDVLTALNGLGLGLAGVPEVNLVTRSAPMGPVGDDVVAATFYNPNPAYVATVVPDVWAKAAPEEILACQERAFSPVLAGALVSFDAGELAELAGLARAAGEAASRHPEGRPLFSAFASRPWPEAPHLVIWHAAKLLREHRGDGHIAALVVEGLGSVDALVIHAAFDGLPATGLRDSRRWSPEDWDLSVQDLRRRGWLTGDATLTLSPDGRRRRRWIEDRTDDLAAVAYEPLGDDGMRRMVEIGTGMIAALRAAGVSLPWRPPPAALGSAAPSGRPGSADRGP